MMATSAFNELTLSLTVIIPTTFEQQYLEKMVTVNIDFTRTFLKKYSISFLLVCRLIDFAIVVLKLLMFKVGGIFGISEVEFFNFCCTESVKENWKKKKKIKKHLKPPKLVNQSLFK